MKKQTIIVFPENVRHLTKSAFDSSKALRQHFNGALNSGFIGFKADAITLYDNKTEVSPNALKELFPQLEFNVVGSNIDIKHEYQIEGLAMDYQRFSKAYIASPRIRQ